MKKYNPKVTPWQVSERDFPHKGSSKEQLKFLLKYAILAPSSHNSQPWKFHILDNKIEIFADKGRWLKVADDDQRELYISIGCALENLLIAAEYFGYVHQEEYYLEDKDSLVVVVKLIHQGKIERPRNPVLFEQIPKRYTNHNIYETRKIPKAEMAHIHSCIFEEGFWLFSTNEGPHIRFNEEELRCQINELITRADAIQLTNRAYTKELGFWIGQGAFGTPWLISKIGQLVVTYLNISKGQMKKDSEMLLSAPALVTLASVIDDRKTQVMVGQVFERIALTATSLGMAIHPMSQILEVPEIKAEFRELLEVSEEKAGVAKLSPEENVFPQKIFRLGYAVPEKEHTPRRPLEEVLV